MATSNDALVADLFERLMADGQPDPVVDLVLAALDGWEALDQLVQRSPTGAAAAHDRRRRSPPARSRASYLAGITAAGFRGIGAAATLPLEPGPGLTVVAGATAPASPPSRSRSNTR